MKILGSIFTLLYIGLMIFAIYKDRSKSISSVFIVVGCLLAFVYTLLNVVWDKNLIIILVIGMINISIGTLFNGLKQNNIHVHHHIIRSIVEMILIVICRAGR